MNYFRNFALDVSRQSEAFKIRMNAALLSLNGPFSADNGHTSNGDEQRLSETLMGSFTKGLAHSKTSGLIEDVSDFDTFVRAINSGNVKEIAQLPLGPPAGEQFMSSMAKGTSVRGWESMAAGLSYNIEGPDPQRVTMPPAPQIESVECAFELSEVYWMALLRDIPFSEFSEDTCNTLLTEATKSLRSHPWASQGQINGHGLQQVQNLKNIILTDAEERRVPSNISSGTIFRGNTKGDDVGPYLSQFLLVGSKGLGSGTDITDGFINYGSIRIDQRVRVATEKRDYMTSWQAFVDVQNGADVRELESYQDGYRFITTGRDLATYVHYDALYQAYLNACLLMLAMKLPFDKGIPFQQADSIDKQTGFAMYGGPHILTLVTEVATRALKSVRFQKFNIHRRPRPEAVAGFVDAVKRGELKDDDCAQPIKDLLENLDEDMLCRIAAHNLDQNCTQVDKSGPRGDDYDPVEGTSSEAATFLLPMAFAEGSPMHPAYGAGHATVAGACVTMLKAFFDMDETIPFAFEASQDGKSLVPVKVDTPLTVEGELNKLCSNISIGRDWAGVHWFSDYRESITLGEEIAIQILKEHKLTYAEHVTMTVPKFDGTYTTI